MTERQRPLGAVSSCLHCGETFVARNASHVFCKQACRHGGEVPPHKRVIVDVNALGDLDDEAVIVGMAMAAGRDPEGVARAVLDRGDTVTAALLAAGEYGDAFEQLVAVLERHDAMRWAFDLFDLVEFVGREHARRSGMI